MLSRNNAQRPVHRLRFPQEKARNRRLYAFGFYGGSVLSVGLLIGLWTRWCLGKRDPWLWAIFYVIEGKNKWTRPALLCYWALLGSLSVAGWNRQLARSRRFRPRNTTSSGVESVSASVSAESSTAASLVDGGSNSLVAPMSTGQLGRTFQTSFPNIPNLPNGANMSNVATDLLDAADKHVPTLGLNARRKFFHGLAVVMFVPGIAVDVGDSSGIKSHFPTDFSCFTLLLAGIHASVAECCICAVHVRGIYPILCDIPFWGVRPSVYERVSRPQG